MNLKPLSISSILALTVALSACGRDTTPPAPAPAPAPAPMAPVMPEAPATMVAPPPPTMPVAPAPAMTMPTGPVAPVPPPMPAATLPAATTPSDATAMATTLINQGIAYVKANKLDLAQTAVTKLDGMRGDLPASFGPKIDNLKTLLAAAQMSSGKLPAGFKMPG